MDPEISVDDFKEPAMVIINIYFSCFKPILLKIIDDDVIMSRLDQSFLDGFSTEIRKANRTDNRIAIIGFFNLVGIVFRLQGYNKE